MAHRKCGSRAETIRLLIPVFLSCLQIKKRRREKAKISELKTPDKKKDMTKVMSFFLGSAHVVRSTPRGSNILGASEMRRSRAAVQAARFRSASVPYGLPCRIKYDDAEHRHRPAVSCIQFAFFSFAISSAIWRHMSLRNFTSSSKSSMRERGTSFS